ncbi:hypothetical protein JY651_25710 [Pyxidicoccus parkwayensis]|uniref:Lipoprotein n=1 Tax=Pyxidicoccus parkwayensis TaxID=2813578 RepID=A0ABX7NK42_9BACT|nr:hypothetical protein [Pyxidicoccus parkwaysis]QSQ18759.1 hypothetical protein JY651_25710 [Pyxidicoccus parkwaysis]
MRSRVLVPLAVLPLSLMTTGCLLPSTAQYQRLSSGLVGCAPEQIEIANERPMTTVITWEAVCNGHRFFCSGAEHIASCKESPAGSEKQAAPATSEPAHAPAA